MGAADDRACPVRAEGEDLAPGPDVRSVRLMDGGAEWRESGHVPRGPALPVVTRARVPSVFKASAAPKSVPLAVASPVRDHADVTYS